MVCFNLVLLSLKQQRKCTTGDGLSWVGAAKGYKVVIVMPETMSVERPENHIQAYGAELVLTPGSEGMKRSYR